MREAAAAALARAPGGSAANPCNFCRYGQYCLTDAAEAAGDQDHVGQERGRPPSTPSGTPGGTPTRAIEAHLVAELGQEHGRRSGGGYCCAPATAATRLPDG